VAQWGLGYQGGVPTRLTDCTDCHATRAAAAASGGRPGLGGLHGGRDSGASVPGLTGKFRVPSWLCVCLIMLLWANMDTQWITESVLRTAHQRTVTESPPGPAPPG
jgi:hypothetical protein